METRPCISIYGHYKHITRSFQYKTLKNVLQLNIKIHTCGYQKTNVFFVEGGGKKTSNLFYYFSHNKNEFEIKSRFTLQVA